MDEWHEYGAARNSHLELTTSLFNRILFYLLRWVYWAFRLAFLFIPGILCAHLILEGKQLNGWIYFGAMVGIIYTIECLIFFLKGIYIGLKQDGNKFWTLLLVLCGLYGFVFPIYLLHVMIYDLFKPAPGHSTQNLTIISWVVGGLAGGYIGSRYKLLVDVAPPLFKWAYKSGWVISASNK